MKNLRIFLDGNKKFEEVLKNINQNFDLKKWGALSNEELNDISRSLDRED